MKVKLLQSCLGHFECGEATVGNHWTGGWVDPPNGIYRRNLLLMLKETTYMTLCC